MIRRIIGVALGLALAMPTLAHAQEESEGGQLYQVTTWTVDPADAAAWEAGIKNVVEAATQADIPYRWSFWQEGSEYVLAYPVANFAYFDDPGQFMRAFAGTPGEALVNEAMAGFSKLNVQVVSDEIVQRNPDWSYEAEGFSFEDLNFGHIDVIWLKNDVLEEFNQINKDWMALYTELGYPYPYDGYEVHFGDSGRVVYVTFVDDLAKMYGEFDVSKLAEAKGMGERMQQLDQAFNSLVIRWQHYDSVFRRDLSYWPAEAETR